MLVDLVTTICNLGTLAVLIAGAAAAIVQLRHVRAGNELAAMLAIERDFQEPDLQLALLYVQNDLPRRLAEAPYRAQLVARGYVDPRTHPEMSVCNWLNDMGTLIAGDFIDENVFFHAYARLVDYYGKLLDPVIALLRRERGDEQYANIDVLTARARRWLERHRGGTYPARVPRMPIADPWLGADSELAAEAPNA